MNYHTRILKDKDQEWHLKIEGHVQYLITRLGKTWSYEITFSEDPKPIYHAEYKDSTQAHFETFENRFKQARSKALK